MRFGKSGFATKCRPKATKSASLSRTAASAVSGSKPPAAIIFPVNIFLSLAVAMCPWPSATQRKKQALAERVEKQSRVRILDAILPRFRFGREIFGFQINQVWRIFVSRRVKLRTEIGAHCATVELDINILVTRLFDGVWSRCPSGEPQWPIPLTGKSSESQFLS
jgi:hypothetical protein